MRDVRMLLTSCALILLATAFALGQAISGDLVGTVRDGSGAVLANVPVEVTNLATGLELTQQTTSIGEYHFANLPVGHYKIDVASNNLNGGFADVEVQLNKTATANVVAQVAGAGTTVEVTGQTETIDTTTAQLQNTYELKQTQDLPSASSSGLGVLNLALLDPGVASSGGIGVGTGPSVSGQRPRNNNFTVEGVDNNSKTVTGPVVIIPNDAVQNFTVLQNQFDSEFGHSSGGQFNQTILSGTNHFHGRLYDYFQNRNLNAIDAATARSEAPGPYTNNPFTFNRAAGQIGGPIFKDKLFFFTNQEYNWVGQATAGSFACAPTALGYTQLAGLPNALGTVNANNLAQYQKWVGTAATPGDTTACGGTANWTTGFDSQGNAITSPYQIGLLNTNGGFYTNVFTSTNAIDWNISPKDQVRGRWVYFKTNSLDNTANLPAFWTNLPVRNSLVTISEYHNFTPSLNNELRLGFNRNTQFFTVGDQSFPGLDAFPNLQVNDMQVQIGADPNAPQFTIQNTYQATDNVSWIHGHHNFKFGVEGRKYISPQGFTQRARGDYEYTTLQGYLDDIAPDYFGERSIGSVTYYGDQSAIYAYGQDQWKINTHLSLDLGVRYEFTSIPSSERLQTLNAVSSVPGLINFTEPQPQYKNFAPRIGFAYSPGTSGNTSIRGGFGMAYDVLFDNLGALTTPPQFISTCDIGNIPTATCRYGAGGTNGNTAFLANGGMPAAAAGGFQVFPDAVSAQESTGGYTPNQQLPYTETWNLGIQHVFANKYTAEVRYVGTRGIHLPVQDRINRQSVVTPTNFLPTYLTAPSQATLNALTTTLDSPTGLLAQESAGGNYGPGYIAGCGAGAGGTDVSPCFASSITSYQPYGKSLYHGLQTQVSRNFTNGLQFQVAWTWSHAWDNSTAEVFSTQLTPRRPQDFQDVAGDYGTSALDRRHRVTVELLYDVTAFKNSNWLMKNVVGNWEVAPVYTFQSPEYWTVQSGIDANLNGDAATDRAIFNPGGVPGSASTVSALTNSAGYTVAYLADNPNAQYIQAAQGALANTARNTVGLPHINNFDLTAVKRFNFTEHTSFEFQAQALNVFNHSQYVAGAISTANATAFTSITSFVTIGQTLFNNPQETFSNNPRTLQLVGKFIF